MRVRTDIDPANTWVISDTHFHDEKNADFHLRPTDVDQLIIAEWRKAIPDDATVIHLGDLNYGNNARFKHLLSKELTGRRKYLIRGNHDRQSDGFYKKSGFFTTAPFKIPYGDHVEVECPACDDGMIGPLGLGGYCTVCDGDGHLMETPFWVSFCHYKWNEATDGVMTDKDIRLHGHIHNDGYTRSDFVPFLKNHINLSVEQTKYKPVNLKSLLDAALFGKYAPTTDAQIEEVRRRRDENYARKEEA